MKVIITGSTGMVGKGVLLECLDSAKISKVLIINRNTLGMQHAKLKEILLKDFNRIATIAHELKGYDACFYCMGISVVGMSEETYNNIIFNMTKSFVDVLFEINPKMIFNYVSGNGTDSTEKGNSMWARVKGKTENYLLNKGFKDAYAFRPGVIIPEKGIKSSTGWYNTIYTIMSPFFGWMKKSKNITTTTKIGLAMINSLSYSQNLKHLENSDINTLVNK